MRSYGLTDGDVKEAFQRSHYAFRDTILFKHKYAPLPFGPSQKRVEDIHLIRQHINLREIKDQEEFIKDYITPLAEEASRKIFAAGRPLGFYNMNIPAGLSFNTVWRQEEPCTGLTFRLLMQYDIGDDTFTMALGLRPEYDWLTIDRIMKPGTAAGLLL